MKVKNLMVTNVISVGPETSIGDVADIIFSNRFHGLPVLEDGKVIGIITEDDFFLKKYDDLFLPSYIKFLEEKKIAKNLSEEMKEKIRKFSEAKAQDIMTKTCITVSPETNISDLMDLIKRTQFTTFPVVDDEKNVLGIITLSDILGIVKKGSGDMKKSLNRKKGSTELNRLARDLNVFLNDRIVVMTKRKISTWKGLLLVTTAISAGAVILFFANTNMGAGSNCTSEIKERAVYPLTCQRFTYSNWGQCFSNGTQTREVIQSLPENCEGGTPEVIRSCP